MRDDNDHDANRGHDKANLGDREHPGVSAAISARFNVSRLSLRAVATLATAASLGGGAWFLDNRVSNDDVGPRPTECEVCLAERPALIDKIIQQHNCAIAAAQSYTPLYSEAGERLFSEKSPAFPCGDGGRGTFVEGLDYPVVPAHPADWPESGER